MMKTSILLGVFCSILLSQFDFGEGRATEAATWRDPKSEDYDYDSYEYPDYEYPEYAGMYDLGKVIRIVAFNQEWQIF